MPALAAQGGRSRRSRARSSRTSGPKNYTSSSQADDAAGFATGFKKTVDLGWFAFIGRPLLWLLQQFYAFVGNWGIAIILLTLLVKARDAVLDDQVDAVDEGDGRARAADEGAAGEVQGRPPAAPGRDDGALQAHNVNPLAGCLPILLQMPIWLALYRMLSSAGELYQQPFIPGWIDDLTAPDPYHILPVVLVVTMFAAGAAQRRRPATSGQQKMIQYGMPLMFGVMSFFFPAGLTLYIFTNTCLSALHSIYMNKFDTKSLEIMARMKANQEAVAAAAEAAAKPAGKGGGEGSCEERRAETREARDRRRVGRIDQ